METQTEKGNTGTTRFLFDSVPRALWMGTMFSQQQLDHALTKAALFNFFASGSANLLWQLIHTYVRTYLYPARAFKRLHADN